MTATPQRFTKRPVTIEAIQWDGTQSGATPIIDWILDHDHSADYWAPGEWDHETNAAYINITTLEGNMIAQPGDWIIRGVQGECYPCKDAIFRETYEAAESSEWLAARDRPLREQVARAYGIGDLTSRPLRDAQDEIKRLENLVRSLRRENRRLENTIARRDQRCEDLAAVEQQRLATLALVEQQRIANLIALVAADPDGLGQSAYSALAAMSPDRRRTILDPDIAAALGIGDDDE